MKNWETDAARSYHEGTKHSYESVRASGHALDWANRPHPFKEYVGLEAVRFPVEAVRVPGAGSSSRPSFADLAWILRWGAGVIRTRRTASGEVYSFRTYSSAGALYPVEVYAACADLPGLAAGLYHFHPGELVLRRLRDHDVRGVLAAAADEPALNEAGVVLLLTGILWRTSWKYQARGYRHLYWDAGTMLANVLALAASARCEARLLTGFVDDDVNRLLGVDGQREAALAVLSVGGGEPAAAARRLEPLELGVAPLARHEVPYPNAYALHEASSLATADEIRRYRASGDATGGSEPAREPEVLESVLRRRGSVRDFAPDAIALDELVAVLAEAATPIPADVPSCNDIHLIANAVDGIEPGAYRFEPPDHLELLRPGNFRLQAGFLALEQPFAAQAAATHFLLADLERVLAAHGNRGYRAAQLEAGIRAGRIYIAAFAQRLGATASTFYDDAVTEFFAPGRAKRRCCAPRSDGLLADRFHDDALAAPAVELGVEDPLPWPEVERAVGDRQHDLVRHQVPLEVGVRVVLAVVVPVLVGRCVGRKALEPVVDVLDQARLGVVHVDRRRDVHRVDEAEAVLDARRTHERLHAVRDVDVVAPVRRLEDEVVGRVLDCRTLTGATRHVGTTGRISATRPGLCGTCSAQASASSMSAHSSR
jgi:SagB-type dehydrogenase family enzyme